MIIDYEILSLSKPISVSFETDSHTIHMTHALLARDTLRAIYHIQTERVQERWSWYMCDRCLSVSFYYLSSCHARSHALESYRIGWLFTHPNCFAKNKMRRFRFMHILNIPTIYFFSEDFMTRPENVCVSLVYASAGINCTYGYDCGLQSIHVWGVFVSLMDVSSEITAHTWWSADCVFICAICVVCVRFSGVRSVLWLRPLRWLARICMHILFEYN